MTEHDPVNHPTHYASSATCSGCGESIECIDVVRHLEFNLGNAIKYLWRAGKKDDIVQDLKKAVWYIEDQIAMLEGKKNPNVHRLSMNEQIYEDVMWKQANPAIGDVVSMEETTNGLDVNIDLSECAWVGSNKLSSVSFDFLCTTHSYHMIMPIDKAPAYCNVYADIVGER